MKYKNSKSDIVLIGIAYTTVIILTFSIIIPFLLIFLQSITPRSAMTGEWYSIIPKQVTFDAYGYLLVSSKLIIKAFKNSFFLVVIGGSLSLIATTMAAYTLSKQYLPYRKILTYFVYIPMIIGGGLIPTFLVVKFIGLYGSLWACVIPGMVGSWNVFLMRNFFREIPESLEEAALLDGANDVQILVKVMLPVSLPAIATIGLFYAVGQWNSWFTPSIYLNSREQWPVQMVVRQMLAQFDWTSVESIQDMEELLINIPTDNVKKASVFIATLPVLVFYPFAQKYFVKGLVVGSIKG
ncbi:MAG TPA: carbohydrate ABC transporter permease [Clostridiales bacterium]|nr:carbohydrate ABC transporter permease [Clostridiales bacterium]